MSWRQLLFAHWPVDPDAVEPHIPDELELQTRDGAAWIGVVPFDMVIKGRGMPRFGKQSHFLELNVRTYVTRDGKPGVWFFSLDAERWLAVRAARMMFHLPYFDADMSLEGGVDVEEDEGSEDDSEEDDTEDESVTYRSERTHDGADPARFEGCYKPTGEPYRAEEGTLEHFLTERYCLYAHDGVSLYRSDVHHEPWPIQRAEVDIETNTLGEPFDLPLEGEPELVHFARRIDVVGWLPERIET